MSTQPELMTDEEQTKARLLIEARVRDVRHLHRLMEDREPGLADYTTVWRYWRGAASRMHFPIVRSMARVLRVDADELYLLLRREESVRQHPTGVRRSVGRTTRRPMQENAWSLDTPLDQSSYGTPLPSPSPVLASNAA